LVLEKHILYWEGLDAIYATVIFKDLFAVTLLLGAVTHIQKVKDYAQ